MCHASSTSDKCLHPVHDAASLQHVKVYHDFCVKRWQKAVLLGMFICSEGVFVQVHAVPSIHLQCLTVP